MTYEKDMTSSLPLGTIVFRTLYFAFLQYFWVWDHESVERSFDGEGKIIVTGLWICDDKTGRVFGRA